MDPNPEKRNFGNISDCRAAKYLLLYTMIFSGRESISALTVEDLKNQVQELDRILTDIREDRNVETLNELRLFAEKRILKHLDLGDKYADTLTKFLIFQAAAEERTTKSRTNEIQIAFNCLYLFLTKVDAIQEAFERLATTEVAMLRLDLHCLESPEDHQLLACKFILFLTSNIKKFGDISLYVRRPKKIIKLLEEKRQEIKNEVPIAPRFSEVSRVSVQASYYDVDTKVVLDSFLTHPTKGLSDDEAQSRGRSGKNVLPKPKPPGFFILLLHQVKDFMIIILVLATIATFILEKFEAGVALIIVIVVNITIGFVQEWKAEKALHALLVMQEPKARVIRSGETKEIDAADLVPGDIVILKVGDSVPADLRLIEVSELAILEQILTGESEPVTKTTAPIRDRGATVGDRKNMAFMMTSVNSGQGKGVVVMIGVRTEAGKISESLATAKQPITPLQKRIDILGKILVVVAVVFCAAIVGIGRAYERPWLDLAVLAVSLGVSVIPEGLVAVTTVTMAIGVQRMAKKNAIVKKLTAVETLGSVSVICSDKTGTLTEGKMKVMNLWTGSKTFDFTGAALTASGNVVLDKKKLTQKQINESPYLSKCLTVMCLCNGATITVHEDNTIDSVGTPTEVACLVGAMRGGYTHANLVNSDKDYEETPKKSKKKAQKEKSEKKLNLVAEFPFDSTRKRMSVVYQQEDDIWVYAKGGTESILSICTHQDLGDGIVPLTNELKKAIEDKAVEIATKGLRVLALALRKGKGDPAIYKKKTSTEKKLTFIGLVGIIDPERPEVKDAIVRCQRAGIKVCMITGDHPTTAKAIAMNLGISTANEEPLNGVDIDVLVATNKLEKLDPFPSVFARVSPENKLQIVKALQAHNHVVAMTGDGVNDAPAIRSADCGIAMGKTGTDITKQAAAIVLADDNFETIARAVEDGRVIYNNIQKFILYILSANSAEILTVITAICFPNAPVPFTTIQILFANIIADIPPAMALGIDAPERDVMQHRPRSKNAPILSVSTGIMLLSMAASMAALALLALLIPYWYFGYSESQAQVFCFVLLTTCQLFHGFLCRSKSTSIFRINPLTNKWMIVGVFGSFICLLAAVYIPGLNSFLDLAPMRKILVNETTSDFNSTITEVYVKEFFPAVNWGFVFAALLVHVIMVEIMKVFARIRLPCFQRTGRTFLDSDSDSDSSREHDLEEVEVRRGQKRNSSNDDSKDRNSVHDDSKDGNSSDDDSKDSNNDESDTDSSSPVGSKGGENNSKSES